MTTSRLWSLVVAGYSILAVAMLAFLTINGVSNTAVGAIGTAGLLCIGLLLPTAGLLELARRLDSPHGALRRGLLLLSVSLIGLMVGLVVSFFASSVFAHVVSGAVIVLSGISGLVGAIFVSNKVGVRQLVVGAALIAIGAVLIPASDIALNGLYWILDLEKNIYQDIGATVAACGCVVFAYSCFVLRTRSTASVVHSPRRATAGR